MSLDPPKSDRELLELARKRGSKIEALPTDQQLLERANRKAPERRQVTPRPRKPVVVGKVERHLEAGRLTGLTATIYGAPRTKKNAASSTGGFLSTPGYKHWCRGIVAGLLPERVTLPEEPLNLEAHFYVDARGVPADLVGLLQGLCDALQAAKVVTDDNWIRGFDGSRIHYTDQHHPRCQLELSPQRNV